MSFLDNFIARCEARGETPSHALVQANLSKSILSKLKKNPELVPSGKTISKLANYLGCTADELLSDQTKTTTSIKIQNLVDRMEPEDQEYLYRLIRFVWSDLK